MAAEPHSSRSATVRLRQREPVASVSYSILFISGFPAREFCNANRMPEAIRKIRVARQETSGNSFQP
jgi:hypothetical protein